MSPYFRFFDTTYVFWGPENCSYRWCDILYLPFVLLLVQKFACPKVGRESDENSIHLVDKPIKEPYEDLFNYDSISKGLLSDLSTVDVLQQSFSVGILGEWGQGKSSFMNLFKLHAEKDGAIIVCYSPRSSKSFKCIQEDFFDALKESLSHYHTGIRRYISNYARSVADVDEGWTGKIALALNQLTRMKEKERINNVIRSIGRRIYILIEDLDRLTGDELLEVFKLIERNGDFCNTVFITAYDKSYVNEVIGHYLGHNRHQDYTDKYFDYEYPLPLNTKEALGIYAKKYFSDHVDLSSPDDKAKQSDLIYAWDNNEDYIVKHLGTMRHVKRFINVLMSRYPKVKNNVVASDFLLLTLLRYEDLESYYAVFNMRFLRRGSSLISGTPKLIYLQDNYLDTINHLSISDSSREIIELLFKKKENYAYSNIEDEYMRLSWADSFYNYFFDYTIGEYHYEDFLRLFEDDCEDAFVLMLKMHEGGYGIQLEDFLRSRNERWISDGEGLNRYLSLLIYLDSLNRTLGVENQIDRMTHKDIYAEYENVGVVKNEESYRNVILNVYRVMMEKCPLEIGFSCQRVLQALLGGRISENDLILSAEELKAYSIWAQRKYYERYPSGDYNFDAIINLAIVREEEQGKIIIAVDAKRAIASLMMSFPKQFAKDLIIQKRDSSQQGHDVLNLHLIESFDPNMFLPVDDFSFERWLSEYLDEKTSYVVRNLFNLGRNNVIRVPALKLEYGKGDIEGYFEALKKQEEIDDDNVVRGVIEKNLSLDLNTIGEVAGIELERVKESVRRLVDTGAIESHFASLKERIEPFEIGDYVRIISEKYESYSSGLYYSDNIFKIIEINSDDAVKLSDLQVTVPRTDYEAIPIDGTNDRGLYYDPVIAASYVADGEPVPVHHSRPNEYYMDGLEKTKMERGTSLKSIVLDNKCQFVHEVQHCLRREVKNDYLKLNHSIK